MNRSRRRREQSTARRLIVVPLIGGMIAAGLMIAFGIWALSPGGSAPDYVLGRNQFYGPFAWSDVATLAGLLFVVTFLVLAIKEVVWPSQ